MLFSPNKIFDMSLKSIRLTGEQKRVLFLPKTDPIQIKGVAGSGKTTVALYRAKHLIDTYANLFDEAKVAIFTYNKTLVKYIAAIKSNISSGYLSDSDEIRPTKPSGLNVKVTNFHKWAYDFIGKNNESLYGRIAQSDDRQKIISSVKAKYVSAIANKSVEFFEEEISWIKGKIFKSLEEYLDAKRIGRGTNDRVTKQDKEIIWHIYEDYNRELVRNKNVDFDDFALICLKILDSKPNIEKPFTHIVVDEAQDLSKAQILVLSQLVSDETRSISIIADAAQRIYKSGFSWSEVGLNVRGARTIELKKNYRSTVPIVKAALSLLEKEDDQSDFTVVEAARKGEEKPVIGYFNDVGEQRLYLLEQLKKLLHANGSHSIAILHRNKSGLKDIQTLLQEKGYATHNLLDSASFDSDSIKLCTMSSVKGLEFDNVFIVDLNDEVLPYPPGFNGENDEFHISTERRLLYTAMTRARDRLYLLSSGIPSRYLKEINREYIQFI